MSVRKQTEQRVSHVVQYRTQQFTAKYGTIPYFMRRVATLLHCQVSYSQSNQKQRLASQLACPMLNFTHTPPAIGQVVDPAWRLASEDNKPPRAEGEVEDFGLLNH